MERYVEFIFNNRKKLLILLVVINIIALIGLIQIRINVDMKAFLPSSSKYLDSYSIIEEKYNLSDQLIVMIETDKNPLEDLELYKKLWSLQRELENIEGINFISSLFPQSFPGYNIKNPEDINENFLNKISQISMFKDKFFKEQDGKFYSLLTIPLKSEDFKVVDQIEEKLKEVTHYGGGTLFFTKKLFDYLLSIVIFLPPFAFITMLIIFSLQLGSKKLALFSIIPAGLGALWTLGLMGWSGRELSMASVLVPIFTIIMGSADGMHFLTHYIEYIERGFDKKNAVVETLKSTGIAMIMTTITTIIGFISMMLINSNMMKEMGIWTSFGIGFAGIATLYVLPVIIAGNVELKRKRAHMFDVSFVKRFWNKKGVYTYIVLLLIFALLIPTITIKFDQISMFKKYTKIRKDYEKLTSVFEFNIPVMVDFQTTKDPLDKKYLDEMKKLENTLSNEISMFNYPQQFLDVMGKEFFNFKSYPNPIQVLIIKNAIKNNPSIPLFDLINGKSFLGIITTKNNSQKTLEKVQKAVEDLKNDEIFNDIRISGMPYVFNEMNTTVLNSQLKSIIISLILVFISIFIMIRNIKISFYGILPLLGALIVEFGTMALLKIPLNIQRIMQFI
ncbi:MAG: hypothetical protein B6I29_01980 [Marinitoga sp. 4572_148]|nr:MAG: hypothetical protein B6I29_01980 [Marinitoga sp. 4572_148]